MSIDQGPRDDKVWWSFRCPCVCLPGDRPLCVRRRRSSLFRAAFNQKNCDGRRGHEPTEA
jgi:hypothetical protein